MFLLSSSQCVCQDLFATPNLSSTWVGNSFHLSFIALGQYCMQPTFFKFFSFSKNLQACLGSYRKAMRRLKRPLFRPPLFELYYTNDRFFKFYIRLFITGPLSKVESSISFYAPYNLLPKRCAADSNNTFQLQRSLSHLSAAPVFMSSTKEGH